MPEASSGLQHPVPHQRLHPTRATRVVGASVPALPVFPPAPGEQPAVKRQGQGVVPAANDLRQMRPLQCLDWLRSRDAFEIPMTELPILPPAPSEQTPVHRQRGRVVLAARDHHDADRPVVEGGS